MERLKTVTLSLISIFLIIESSQGQSVDTLVFDQGITLLFDSNKDQLTEENIAKIDSFLGQDSGARLYRIEGHTDDIGSEEYNIKLAARRAKSVHLYLTEIRQVDSTKLFTDSYGELKPAKRNLTNEDRKFNRRVDLSKYEVKTMRRIKGNVGFDSLDNSTIAKILVKGKNFRDSTYSNTNGNWSIVVPDSVFISLDMSAPNYFFSSKRIKVSEALDSREIKVELPKLKVGKVYNIPNLYFKANLPILMPASQPTLLLLYETMSTSEVCIHIKGHVNFPNQPPVTESHEHFKLSKARAKKVYDYLEEYGIDPKRMKQSGLGNWQMIYPFTEKESQMKKNRRVEIEITECQ